MRAPSGATRQHPRSHDVRQTQILIAVDSHTQDLTLLVDAHAGAPSDLEDPVEAPGKERTWLDRRVHEVTDVHM